jgi:hypothetical protein
MPAVSTSTTSRPSTRRNESVESRVVPGSSATMLRSSPSRAFSSDDLPTLGRPTIASRGGPVRRRRGGSPRPAALGDRHLEVDEPRACAPSGDDLRKAEPVELGAGGLELGIVRLVRDHHDLRSGAAQQLGDLLVARQDAVLRVDHEHDHRRLGDDQTHLAPDRPGDAPLRIRV